MIESVALRAPTSPPGEVVFSSPTDGETGVSRAGPIRIQFSRGLDPATLDAHVLIRYAGSAADAPAIDSRVVYDAGNHAIEIRLANPLDAFKTVQIQIVDGVKMFDGAALTPWSVMFAVGDR